MSRPWKKRAFNDRLAEAVESFERERAGELCGELVAHLRERDDPYPLASARTVLSLLRRKRYFDLLQQVCDTLIQNAQAAPVVRRMYAQSLLDQSNLTAALSILEDLVRDTAAEGEHADAAENAEARGLVGRAYKQLYVDADRPQRSRHRVFLERAIAAYHDVYRADPTRLWHAVNGVALLRRAHEDGVELEEIADPALQARAMASQIVDAVERRHRNQEAEHWDYATAAEACIGLDDGDGALRWLSLYLRHLHADAFELGSTYRQLTEVWKLTPNRPPGDRLLPALRSAWTRSQGSVVEIRAEDAARETLDELAADGGYEKVLGSESFRSLRWFQVCMRRAGSVARVLNRMDVSLGTGFVVRGGDLKAELGDELLVLTNAHVISSDFRLSRALRPQGAVVKFDLWPQGESPEFRVKKLLWSSSPDQLDASLVRLDPVLEGLEPLPITDVLPARDGRQRAYVIGHPGGRKLSFSIHDNHLLDYDDRLLHYRSPTEGGSSGSPVFNDEWDLIALHHRGLTRMPRLHDQEGTYPANEGIWIEAIRQALRQVELS